MRSKKIIALVLSVVMIAWQMPAFVFAQEEDNDVVPAETTVQEEPADKEDDNEATVPEADEEPAADPDAEDEVEAEDQADVFNSIIATDEAYLIGSETDWNEFCTYVNNGEISYEKPYVLTADIVVSEMMAGLENYPFSGVFDGQGHKITLDLTSNVTGAAPFRYIKDATIKNLTVDGDLSGSQHSAGLVGFNLDGTSSIMNVEVKADISNGSASGKGHVGGVLGHNKTSTINMDNVTFSGTINNLYNYAGGLIGWSDSSTVNMNNCVFSGSYTGNANFHPVICKGPSVKVYGTFKNVYYFTEANFTGDCSVDNSGDLVRTTAPSEGFYKGIVVRGTQCYVIRDTTISLSLRSAEAVMVNGLDYDTLKVTVKFGNDTVADEDYTYVITDSEGTPVTTGMQFDAGEYTVTATAVSGGLSGSAQSGFTIMNMLEGSGKEEDPYLIYDTEDWDTFTYLVDVGNIDKPYHGAYYKLMDNIEVTKPSGKTASDCFRGTFDGNNKTITVDLSGTDHVAPFGMLIGATVKDLKVEGTINASDKFAGGIAGEINRAGPGSAHSYIINCVSNVTINSSVSGDGTHGGLVGKVTQTTVDIKNSAFTGKIIGSDTSHCGGIVGWLDYTSGSYLTFTDVIFAPSGLDLKSNNCCTIVRTSENGASWIKYSDSTYYITSIGTKQGLPAYAAAPSDELTLKKTISGVEFYATGNATLAVDGTPYSYTGDPIAVTPVVKFNGKAIDAENYTVTIYDSDEQAIDDVTEVGSYSLTITGNELNGYYGSLTEPFDVVPSLDGDGSEENPYLIHNAAEWDIMADKIANGLDLDKHFKLADDYDSSTPITTPVGSEAYPFAGVFDGNGQELSVDIEDTTSACTAPFRYIAGAAIKDLRVSGTVTGGLRGAGLVGYNWSGSSTISNCIVDVNISGNYAGGIVGHGKSAKLTLDGCVYCGTLVSATEKSAGLVGWMDNANLEINNCLFSGINSTNKQFHPIALKSQGSSVTKSITDCYYLTDPTTTTGDYVLGSTIGFKVTADAPSGVIYKKVTAADGNTYYADVGVLRNLYADYYSTTGLELDYSVGYADVPALEENTDYYVTYTRDGEAVESVDSTGNYVITAHGKAPYGGTTSFDFTVHESVKYQKYDEATGTFTTEEAPSSIIKVTSSLRDWKAGWYVVDVDVTISNRVYCNGSPVNLILTDVSSLKCLEGISVNEYKEFNIFGQINNTGKLTCSLRDCYGYAGIGGDHDHTRYGKITINGGNISSTASRTTGLSNPAAGIGGGFWEGGTHYNNVGSVTINGGIVNASSPEGAGIGGGDQTYPGTITIRGGQVTASGYQRKGIGRGVGKHWAQSEADMKAHIYITWNDPAMRVTSNGYDGDVTLQKYFKAGDTIYYGSLSDTQKTAIRSKTLIPCEAYSVSYHSGEGSGADVSDFVDTNIYTLRGGDTFTPPAGKEFAGWLIDDTTEILEAGRVYELTGNLSLTAIWEIPVIPYVDADNNGMDPVLCYPINPSCTELNDTSDTSGWYAVTRNVTVSTRIEVDGDVNIILVNGATLTAPKGISVTEGNSLTIWGQTGGTGKILIDNVDTRFAGIGGDFDVSGYEGIPYGTITINGGTFDVTGGSNGAGIGGSYQSEGNGTININAGTIRATGGQGGAGIGGAYEAQTGTINITGGTITAVSQEGAGIGSGTSSHDDLGLGVISISGGFIYASTSSGYNNKGASIGGGAFSSDLSITISGGEISAPSGIGAGDSGTAKKTAISMDWSYDCPDMRVATGSYRGTVILAKPFKDEVSGTVYPATENANVNDLAGTVLVPDNSETIVGHSLTLDGRIGVNYYVYVPSGLEPGTMTFDISGRGDVETKSGYTVEDGFYVYTCYVTSVQMADTITATYTSDNANITEEYSVVEYLEYFDEHEDEYDDKTIALVHALADYGYYVQPFLMQQNGWTFGGDDGYAEMTTYYSGSIDYEKIKDELEDVSVSANVSGSGLTGLTYSLRLDSSTEIDVFLKSDSDIDLSECPYPVTKLDDGRYKVQIKNISAADFDKEITVAGVAAGEFSVTLSPLCYIKSVMNSNNYGFEARNAMAAAYNYYKAAAAYVE